MLFILQEILKREFLRLFGNLNNLHIFKAPARVNLIGEHTDYNGGFVLPTTIDFDILLAAQPRHDDKLNLISLNFKNTVKCSLKNLSYDKKEGWANYPKAVAWALQSSGYKLKGMNFIFAGNIPTGSGLSSSAAVEIITCLAFVKLLKLKITMEEMAFICKKAENEFIGVKCGIMDQFVIALNKKDKALFLDCRSLKYKYLPLNMKGVNIVISDTKVERKLINSKYNERRQECEKAVEVFRKYIDGINDLRNVSIRQFSRYKSKLPVNIRKRVEHVIYENERVKAAVQALRKNSIDKLGKLMLQSHYSLRNLYKVSCKELDIMVNEAMRIKGTLGSKMTGAGFGGCTVSLVKSNMVDDFIDKVGRNYYKKTHIKPEFYVCKSDDCAEKLYCSFSK